MPEKLEKKKFVFNSKSRRFLARKGPLGIHSYIVRHAPRTQETGSKPRSQSAWATTLAALLHYSQESGHISLRRAIETCNDVGPISPLAI